MPEPTAGAIGVVRPPGATRTALIVAALLLAAPVVRGQGTPPVPTDGPLDVVLASALGELTSAVARAIVSGTPSPVEIQIPDSSAAWRGARDGLMRTLAGRPRTDVDRHYLRVRFTELVIEADTLRASYHVEWMEFCPARDDQPGRWSFIGTSHEVRSVRQHATWPRATVVGAGYTDDWCLAPSRPR